jgi:hypothetical protein
MEESRRALIEVLFRRIPGKTEKNIRATGDSVSPEVRTGHNPHTRLQPYWYIGLLGSQFYLLKV